MSQELKSFPLIQIESPLSTLKNEEFIRILKAIEAPTNIEQDIISEKLSPFFPHILDINDKISASFSCLQNLTISEQVYHAKTPTTQIWTILILPIPMINPDSWIAQGIVRTVAPIIVFHILT